MHECNFELDKDGQVTCSICGAMDDDKEPITPLSWGGTPKGLSTLLTHL